MAYPGAGRQHHQQQGYNGGGGFPEPQQYGGGGYQGPGGYGPPSGPPPNQWGAPPGPPPPNGGYTPGYNGGGGGGFPQPQTYQQQPDGFAHPNHNQNYAPPPNMQNPMYQQPPPAMQRFNAPQGNGPPSQYQGGQFQVHMQPQGQGRGGMSNMYSNCSGRRKALCIGINYVGTSNALAGCHNDARNISKFLIERYNYKQEDIVMLLDTPGAPQMQLPTRANIVEALHYSRTKPKLTLVPCKARAMNWLVQDARPNDALFFHYSGHGGQAVDTDGDEDDGYDETIYPVDFKQSGQMVDDEMHEIMVRRLPQGCRLTAIFDSCHSGSALDLPYIYSTKGVEKTPNMLADAGSGALSAAKSYMRGDMSGVFGAITSVGKKMMNANGGNAAAVKQAKSSMADCISWSGCKDSQTSADTSEAGKATGAMSFAFIAALTKYPQQSYLQLLNTIRDELKGRYDQKPQLSCSHELDVNLLFVL